ncbi:hypothetical protein PIB30_048101 [Stylosanthes scabra]|uniref:Uncharacterized protein n=1 Tax=Stylosanthes scabra TaxID=79078 RepID=A0ABU6XHU0_9FABA|nr:hypothetical protein [Stylosanthes scabra]
MHFRYALIRSWYEAVGGSWIGFDTGIEEEGFKIGASAETVVGFVARDAGIDWINVEDALKRSLAPCAKHNKGRLWQHLFFDQTPNCH